MRKTKRRPWLSELAVNAQPYESLGATVRDSRVPAYTTLRALTP